MSLLRGLATGAATTAIAMVLGSSAAAAQKTEDATAKAQEVLTGKDPKTQSKKSQGATGSKSVSTNRKSDDDDPKVSNESGRLTGDIVVTGLRENVKSARAAKRRAAQIVDVVLAQDIGKLPDKNISEALARVPGIQIERERGEGGKVRIRGLENVMTTVNGSPTFSGTERGTALNDISSDLVAGIEVYKTRSADQVEGSQTGVINLTLRRPTDFKEGATYAFNVRADYADQVKRINPYASALVVYNANTDIGQMGFMVNGTFNDINYRESNRWVGPPDRIWDSRQNVSPSTTPTNIYIPSNVGIDGSQGKARRAAFQASTQWKPNDNLSFVLEGGYGHERSLWEDSNYVIPLNYSGSQAPPPRLYDLVMSPDGRLVTALKATSIDPQGPGRQSRRNQTSNYNGRFQMNYTTDRAVLTASANYQRSEKNWDNIFHWIRFAQQPGYDIVFNDPNDPKGGLNIKFTGVDLMDPKNYTYIDGFDQARNNEFSDEIELKTDLRLNTFAHFIDYFKTGLRFTKRRLEGKYGARSYGGLRLPISSISGYELKEIGNRFPGSAAGANLNWLIGDAQTIRDQWMSIINRIAPLYADDENFSRNYYPRYDPFRAFSGPESSVAAYALAHYNVKLLFPIEGEVGIRAVNLMRSLRALNRTESRQTINGETVFVRNDTIVSSRGNSLDLLPNVNAIVHFTPKLQLRLAYTHDVGRPGVGDLNPQVYLDLQNSSRPTGRGGNARLGPVTTTKYDASLEWYFGSTGLASVAVWQWNQQGYSARRSVLEILPESPTTPVLVERPYALGQGRHRGIEGQVTTFFTFLPGILKSFGASVNGTLNITRQAAPNFDRDGNMTFVYGPYYGVSKYVYNLTGFFERGGLNVRVAYNWRSRYQRWLSSTNPYQNEFYQPIERLDASINYDITKNLTVALEGSNLTQSGNRSFWGTYELPQDVRYFSRNFSFSVRTRF